MNPIDELELLSNVLALRREANALLNEIAGAGHAARLRRIMVILGYMLEHLQMVTVFPAQDELINDEPQPTVDSAQRAR